MPFEVEPIHTPLPPHVKHSAILALLRDHPNLILFNPHIVSCSLFDTASDSSSRPSQWMIEQGEAAHASIPGSKPPKYYSITHKNPVWEILPTIQCQAAMVDVDGGLAVVVEAPGGTKIWQRWSIAKTESDGEQKVSQEIEGPWTLVERPTVDTWSLFGGFVDGQLSATHREIHGRIKGVLDRGEHVSSEKA